MRDKGVRFVPIWGRQAYKVDGKFKFWGGLTVEAWGGGPGLVESATEIARKHGIDDRATARAALSLIADDDGVHGRAGRSTRARPSRCAPRRSCWPAAASRPMPRWRTRYLGPGWDLAKVRGTRFNTGDGISMALDIGAQPTGNWSGCHAVGWDRNAPEFGDLAVGDNFQKHSYPLGIMVNANGERFVDEGADFRNYTYAKYGRVILTQPGQFAWQIFDAQGHRRCCATNTASSRSPRCAPTRSRSWRASSRTSTPTRRWTTISALQRRGDDRRPVRSERQGRPRHERARASPKSNWANTIDDAAVRGLCGDLRHHLHLRRPARSTRSAQVIDADGAPIPGLYAAGELVGGLFYFNYPGGTGLMSARCSAASPAPPPATRAEQSR